MKSYTDIKQSKLLVEILPLESADMGYLWNGTSFCEYPVSNQTIFNRVENIPCWSLAALLNVLPNEIVTDSRFECHYQIDIRKYDGGDNTTLYQIAYGNSRGLSGSWHDMVNTGEKESLIDACVQMIEILHERKLL